MDSNAKYCVVCGNPIEGNSDDICLDCLRDIEDPYFRDKDDRCPPLGMQGGVVRTRRRSHD